MSNFLSIAAVTAALRRGLLPVLQADVAGADVTTARPDRPGGVGMPARGVNVYLYQAHPNPTRRNEDLPTRDANGRLVKRPRVALNLDYLFSFYGNEGLLEPQRLLGTTVRYLHSRPEITRNLIEAAMADAATSFLARANLAEEPEPVRFTPLPLSLEDMSRIWSTFFQVPYVLSTAYRAGVVVIEPVFAPAPALPVRDYGLAVLPFVRAVIEQAVPEDTRSAGVSADGVLLLRGAGLGSLPLLVLIEGTAVRITQAELVGGGIRLRLLRIPNSAVRAGVKAVKVVREADLGQPPVPHRALESNVAAFLLQPAAGVPRVSGGEVRLQVSPPAGSRQQARLLLDAPDGSRSFALEALAPGTEAVRVSAAASAGDPAFNELGLNTATTREALLTEPRPAFAGLTRDPAQVDLASEDGAIQTIAIPGAPGTLAGAAAALEASIRAAGATAAFTAARVFADGDRMVIVPGAPAGAFRFGAAADDPAIDELGLRTASPAGALLSDDLPVFAGLSQDPADLVFSIGDRAGVAVAVSGSPNTLNAAATALESALQAASPDDLFSAARVRMLNSRLLILHGRNDLRFALGPTATEPSRPTVPAGQYLMRVEVDGAASPLTTNPAGQYIGPLVTVP